MHTDVSAHVARRVGRAPHIQTLTRVIYYVTVYLDGGTASSHRLFLQYITADEGLLALVVTGKSYVKNITPQNGLVLPVIFC